VSLGTLVFNIVFIALVLGFLLFIGWLLWLFFTGRQRRGRAQSAVFGEFPPVPADPGEVIVGPTGGLYLGTTPRDNWIERVQVDDIGDRAQCDATGYTHGVAIERHGASTVWIPHANLLSVATTNRAAGKVMHAGGLLAFDWALPGGQELTTALRADDKGDYPHWLVAYPGLPAESAPDTTTTDPDAAE